MTAGLHALTCCCVGGAESGQALDAQLAAAEFSTPQALEALPLAERWIVSRVHQVRVWERVWVLVVGVWVFGYDPSTPQVLALLLAEGWIVSRVHQVRV